MTENANTNDVAQLNARIIELEKALDVAISEFYLLQTLNRVENIHKQAEKTIGMLQPIRWGVTGGAAPHVPDDYAHPREREGGE